MTVFLVFLRLGLTSFGGPIAHLGYFREEFVRRRAWLTEQSYADLVALGQFLPGPASSQVGMAIGYSRGGFAGAISAWLGFTLPSAILMIGVALSLAALQQTRSAGVVSGVIHGLNLVAVAVVAQAVLGMARAHCRNLRRVSIALAATIIASLWVTSATQVCIIIAAAVAGALLQLESSVDSADALPVVPSHRTGVGLLGTAVVILVALSVAARFDVPLT
ncbi:MAG: chromate transporter, partial [Gemmatimonadaceae bacterium]